MIVLSVIGARPQFVKCAAVSRAIARHNADSPGHAIREIVVHTGQHYDEDMSGVFFRELELPDVAYNLGVGSASHAVQTAGMLSGLEKLLKRHAPDLVLVHGDTNSTLAGALAAAKLGIPVAHVEAGLRSYNRAMPEEINRILVDHSSQWLFCPSESAVSNLGREGIRDGVHQIGDVMYDVLLWHRSRAVARSDLLAGMGLRSGEYVLATVHRAENTDEPGRLGAVFEALNRISERGLPVVVPLHPRTRKVICEGALETGTLRIVAPASYETMLCLEHELPCRAHRLGRCPKGGLLAWHSLCDPSRRDGMAGNPGRRVERLGGSRRQAHSRGHVPPTASDGKGSRLRRRSSGAADRRDPGGDLAAAAMNVEIGELSEGQRNRRPVIPVSVVIVAWNAERYIGDCLSSVERLERDAQEVVVVDNASQDDTARLAQARHPRAKVIRQATNVGFARANNIGIAANESPFLLVLNPDTRLEPDFLEKLLPAFDDPAVGIACGKLLRFDGRTIDSAGQELGRSRQPIDRGLRAGRSRSVRPR